MIYRVQNQENVDGEQAAAGDEDDENVDLLLRKKKKKSKARDANAAAAGATGEGDAQVNIEAILTRITHDNLIALERNHRWSSGQ